MSSDVHAFFAVWEFVSDSVRRPPCSLALDIFVYENRVSTEKGKVTLMILGMSHLDPKCFRQIGIEFWIYSKQVCLPKENLLEKSKIKIKSVENLQTSSITIEICNISKKFMRCNKEVWELEIYLGSKFGPVVLGNRNVVSFRLSIEW